MIALKKFFKINIIYRMLQIRKILNHENTEIDIQIYVIFFDYNRNNYVLDILPHYTLARGI